MHKIFIHNGMICVNLYQIIIFELFAPNFIDFYYFKVAHIAKNVLRYILYLEAIL